MHSKEKEKVNRVGLWRTVNIPQDKIYDDEGLALPQIATISYAK